MGIVEFERQKRGIAFQPNQRIIFSLMVQSFSGRIRVRKRDDPCLAEFHLIVFRLRFVMIDQESILGQTNGSGSIISA